jgi:hypothetical protein
MMAISSRLRRDNALFHISKKHRPIHGSLKHERRDHCALPQAGAGRLFVGENQLAFRRYWDDFGFRRTRSGGPSPAG